MKVKTLLKTLRNVEYNLLSEEGWLKEEGYVGDEYYEDSYFEDSKVVKLKKLDKKAKKRSMVFGLIFGTISSLVFGTGMCFAMGVLGGDPIISMVIGVVVGIIGLIGCLVNYPIYKKMLKKDKEKYAGDIIQLAKEIVEEE